MCAKFVDAVGRIRYPWRMHTTSNAAAATSNDARAFAQWSKTMHDGFTNLDVWLASRAAQRSLFLVAATGGDDESGDVVLTYLLTAESDAEARASVQVLVDPGFHVSSCQFLAKCDRTILQLVSREED
jgi:hypothetical protein